MSKLIKVTPVAQALLLLLIAGANVQVFAAEPSKAPEKKVADTLPAAEKSGLADGLYLVLRQSGKPEKLQPLGKEEKLVPNDFHFLEPEEREPVVYLVLQTKPFIPFTLSAAPKEDTEQSTGKPRLQLELSEDQKAPLEEFTKAHVGGTVAILIGGEVVTTHKVRTAITGGRLQITRCTKHGCKTLFTRLLKDRN